MLIEFHNSTYLVPAALDFAVRHDRTVDDSLYVALALRQRCQLITADRRLYNALAHHLPDTMLLVSELPPAED